MSRLGSIARSRWTWFAAVAVVVAVWTRPRWDSHPGTAASVPPFDEQQWQSASPFATETAAGPTRMQMVGALLRDEDLIGSSAWELDHALNARQTWWFPFDGFEVPLGANPSQPGAPERWLWVAVDREGRVESLEVTSERRPTHRRHPLPARARRPLPFAVVERLEDWSGNEVYDEPASTSTSWESAPEAREIWHVITRLTLEDGALHVEAGSGNGYYGDSFELWIRVHDDGRVSFEGIGECWSHTGPEGDFALEDFHGVFSFERRELGSRAPLRARFVTGGVGVTRRGFGRRSQEFFGTLEFSTDDLPRGDWERAFALPRLLPRLSEAPPCSLRENRRLDGSLESRGGVDERGRRWGEWTSYYTSGAVRSESAFRNGLRDGPWHGHDEDGFLESVGTFLAGRRHGEFRYRSVRDGRLLEESHRWVAGKLR